MTAPAPHDAPRSARRGRRGGSPTERYVYAATRRVSEDQREDVALELRTSIEDGIEARTSADPLLTPDEAEHLTLVELGDPDQLSAQYTGAIQHLVGPELYPTYVRVLRTLLITVVPIAALVIAAVDLIEGDHFGAVIGQAAWLTLTMIVQISFWTTLAFALTERANGPGKSRTSLGLDPWTPDDLPEIPHASRASLGESVTTVVWLAILGFLIIWQHYRSPVEDGGERIPVLDPSLWSFWIPVILGTLVLEAAFEVVKYRAGGTWTARFAAVNTATGAAFAAPVIWLASQDMLLNPALSSHIQEHWSGFDAGTTHTVILASAVAIWAFDAYDGWSKALRH